MPDDSTIKFSGDEMNLIIRGQDRIENDLREIRSNLSDLRDRVAMKSDMYRILGLMTLAAGGAAGIATFVLRSTSTS